MIYCSFKLAKKLLFCLFQIISQSPSSQRKMLDKTVLSLTKVIQRERRFVHERWDHLQGLGGFCRTCNCKTYPQAPPWRFFPFSSFMKDTLWFWCHHSLLSLSQVKPIIQMKRLLWTTKRERERQRWVRRILAREREETVTCYWVTGRIKSSTEIFFFFYFFIGFACRSNNFIKKKGN